MTFTAAEQEKIRRYFGYPAATGWMHQIQQVCDRVSGASEETEQKSRSLLLQLDQLDSQQHPRLSKAHFAPGQMGAPRPTLSAEELTVIKQSQAALVAQLSALLDLPTHRALMGNGGWHSSGR